MITNLPPNQGQEDNDVQEQVALQYRLTNAAADQDLVSWLHRPGADVHFCGTEIEGVPPTVSTLPSRSSSTKVLVPDSGGVVAGCE